MASKTDDAGQSDTAIATLVVGNTYTYRNRQFKQGVPETVDLDLAKELDALTIGSTDSRSKKSIAQHRFDIEWPDDYTPDEDEDEDAEETKKSVSSGAKRAVTSKRSGIKKPSRATASK